MSNYSKTHVEAGVLRVELHDTLSLTGAEVSVNNLPAGTVIPFYHSHKENEEIYFIVAGKGFMEIDGEKVALEAGDWLRVAPAAKRKLHAETDMLYWIKNILFYPVQRIYWIKSAIFAEHNQTCK